MKKQIVLHQILLISTIIFAIFFNGCGKKEQDVVKIGAILPLSGNFAWLGENSKIGIDIGIPYAEKKYGVKIEVLYEDSKLDPKLAVSIANKMINVDKVDFFIVLGTTIVNAVMPITEKNNKIMFAQTIHPGITTKGNYIYRLYGGGDIEWKHLAEYINNNKLNKIGVFMINAQYGIDSYNSFTKYLTEEVKVEFKADYPIGANDFRNEIIKNLSSIRKVDALILMGYGNEFIPLLKQLREFNFKNKILGNIDFTYPFLKNYELSNGAIFVSPEISIGKKTDVAREFEDEFTKIFKDNEISWDMANSFDTIQLLAELLKNNIEYKSNPNAFYMAFKNMNEFIGASGYLKIDTLKREIDIPLSLATIKDKKIIEFHK